MEIDNDVTGCTCVDYHDGNCAYADQTQDETDIAASNANIRWALRLIKDHITTGETDQNRDLHAAIGILVDEFRKAGRLA